MIAPDDRAKLIAECRERLDTDRRDVPIDWRLLSVLTTTRHVEFGRIARVAATGAYVVLRGGTAPKLTVPTFAVVVWDWTAAGLERVKAIASL